MSEVLLYRAAESELQGLLELMNPQLLVVLP